MVRQRPWTDEDDSLLKQALTSPGPKIGHRVLPLVDLPPNHPVTRWLKPRPDTLPTPAEFRQLREQHGLSLAQCATLLAVDRQTIHRWEAGTRQMPPMALWALYWRLSQRQVMDVEGQYP